MWAAYSQQHWPVAEDLETSVKRLQSRIWDTKFEISHDALYSPGLFYSMQESNTKETLEKLDLCYDYCELYLENKISIVTFCENFIKLGYRSYLDDVEYFLPKGIYDKIFVKYDSDSE